MSEPVDWVCGWWMYVCMDVEIYCTDFYDVNKYLSIKFLTIKIYKLKHSYRLACTVHAHHTCAMHPHFADLSWHCSLHLLLLTAFLFHECMTLVCPCFMFVCLSSSPKNQTSKHKPPHMNLHTLQKSTQTPHPSLSSVFVCPVLLCFTACNFSLLWQNQVIRG